MQLQGAEVAYVLHRAQRRSIGFTVGAEGLTVRAPARATLATVDAALQHKAAWILRKLHEVRERQQRQEQARIVWGDGAVLPYLGAPLRLVLAPVGHGEAASARPRGAVWVSGDPASIPLPGHPLSPATPHHHPGEPYPATSAALHLKLPAHASPEQIRAVVQAWLMRQARAHFTARLDYFAPLLGVRWSRLRLSSAQTRWGSAKADGSIALNWRLLHHAPAVIDYVVAHELAHLRVMDHSPRFWSTLATVVPDHAALRRRLRDESVPRWD